MPTTLAAPTVKLRKHRPGSWARFERLYRPTYDEGGNLSRFYDDPLVLASDLHHVWTLVDNGEGGVPIIVPGYATVNYLGRVITEVPWGDSEDCNSGYYW